MPEAHAFDWQLPPGPTYYMMMPCHVIAVFCPLLEWRPNWMDPFDPSRLL
jgi:hypothetical protein